MLRPFLTAVCATVLLAATGPTTAAQTATPPAPVIVDPSWIKRPSAEDMRAVWPAAAWAKGISGRGLISCEVSAAGTLRRCVVVSETPPGSGYGYAALSLAPQFLMSPKTVDGRPVGGGTVRIPITFRLTGPNPVVSTAVPYVSNPDWIAAPTRAEVAAAYPEKALKSGQTGQATLDCRLAPEGGLRDCRTVAQSPERAGFGAAAMSLTRYFRLAPVRAVSGEVPRHVRVRVPVSFSPPSAGGGVQIARPEWGQMPEAGVVESLYPAAGAGASGKVTLDCLVAAGGALTGCVVGSETPPARGFGEAALALSRHFRMKAWTSDGRPIDGARVRIPLIYEPPGS